MALIKTFENIPYMRLKFVPYICNIKELKLLHLNLFRLSLANNSSYYYNNSNSNIVKKVDFMKGT